MRAGFEAAEYTPTGPNASLMKVFDEIENALMLWFPTSVMVFFCLLLIFRLFQHATESSCDGRHVTTAAPDDGSL